MKKIYLDYAATTPLDPEVSRTMRFCEANVFGNPGSLHSFGQEASGAVFRARQSIARVLGAKTDEIIFTGSATEANNLVLRGVVKNVLSVVGGRKNNYHKRAQASDRTTRTFGTPRIIVSSIEHESVLSTARDLEREGVEVIYLPVTRTGLVDLPLLKKSLNERTVLVSVMYANNEIGTVEPIQKIANIIRDFRSHVLNVVDGRKTTYYKRAFASDRTTTAAFPLFHTDASQALQFLACDVRTLGIDLMTLSSHKIYGPKGVGALYVRNALNVVDGIKNNDHKRAQASDRTMRTLEPLVTGGGQEHGLRSGTENVLGIVGFAEAVRLGVKERVKEGERVRKLRDYLWREVLRAYPRAKKNTPTVALPNNLNVYFPGLRAHDMLIALDLEGVAVSSGSACATRSSEPSHVLRAAGFPLGRQQESIRFSLGRPTTKKEIDTALHAIKNIL